MKRFMKEMISLLKMLLVSYLLIALLTTFIFKPVIVRGSSMYPTLNDGDVGISYVITKKLLGLNRRAVVTAYVPEEDQYIVKRVIGMPGETIYAKDGVVYINDEPLAEPYLDNLHRVKHEDQHGKPFTSDFSKVLIPEDHYFLMGDNRANSKDSRDILYGAFPIENIHSNSLFIFYPFSNFGIK